MRGKMSGDDLVVVAMLRELCGEILDGLWNMPVKWYRLTKLFVIHCLRKEKHYFGAIYLSGALSINAIDRMSR